MVMKCGMEQVLHEVKPRRVKVEQECMTQKGSAEEEAIRRFQYLNGFFLNPRMESGSSYRMPGTNHML